ncbi:MAG: hypothetical protein ACPGXL_06360 [Chitinophagales bacterium]
MANPLLICGITPKALTGQEVEHTFFNKLVLSETLDLTNLMFQTGYLSIKKTNRDPDTLERSFVLGYPNIEVSQSLTHNLLEAFTYKVNSTISAALYEMKQALKKGNVDSFVQQIKILLADINYEILPSQDR